jgi:hypothetical protein
MGPINKVVHRHVVDWYAEWKSIYVDFSGRLQRAQINNQEQL